MESKKKDSKSIILIALIAVLLIGMVALAGVCYKLYSDSQKNEPAPSANAQAYIPPSGNSIVVTEDNRDVLQSIKDKVAAGMIEVKMTNNWEFKDGCKTSNAYLGNSERNKFDLRFEITLASTGQVIMVSPDVPIGSCIENFPLMVELEPGEYEIIVAHQQVKDGEIHNTVRTSSIITVK